MIKTKICIKCGIEKKVSYYYKHTAAKDGLSSKCIQCQKMYNAENKIHIAERNKVYGVQYRIDNIDHRSEYSKIYYIQNKERIVEYTRDHPEIRRKVRQKQRAKRKGWGKPLPINEYFEGSHLHHLHTIDHTTGEVDHQVAIYIPAELHKSVPHSNKNRDSMLIINTLAFEYLYTLLN